MSSRVDRVAAALGRPTEDLEDAMARHACVGREGRHATLGVRLNGTRTFRYAHETSMDRVARELGITADKLRQVMRDCAAQEGRERGVWTISIRTW